MKVNKRNKKEEAEEKGKWKKLEENEINKCRESELKINQDKRRIDVKLINKNKKEEEEEKKIK